MNMGKLPEKCWIKHPLKDELVMVTKGEMGYRPQRKDVMPYTTEHLDYLNQRLGVTKPQQIAMENGSLIGWEEPASDPDNWNENGDFIG